MRLKTYINKLISGQNQRDRSRLVLLTHSGSAPEPALWTVNVIEHFLKVHGKKLPKQSKAPEQEADRIHLKTSGCGSQKYSLASCLLATSASGYILLSRQ